MIGDSHLYWSSVNVVGATGAPAKSLVSIIVGDGESGLGDEEGGGGEVRRDWVEEASRGVC